MEKNREEELNRRINETASGWQPPFSDDSKERAKAAVMARIKTDEAPAGKVVQMRSRIATLSAAAAIAILAGLPFLIYFTGNAEITNHQTAEMKLDLPDGSSATLSSDASIRYNAWLWKVGRSADLSGAAFFEVKPGSTFKIKSDMGEVEVKGTSFSVWAEPNRLLVHCLSGKVAVRGKNDSRDLAPGSLAEISRDQKAIEVSEYLSAYPVMPGSEAMPAFDDVPLPLVCAMLERAFDIEIISELAPGLRFTGELRADARDESLQILCKTFGATYVEEGKSITLMP
ncbi:MAG: FecR family protein [Cryomorphaceae bacterium]|nr:FecR family protein [Flavobacteriales bacterium]